MQRGILIIYPYGNLHTNPTMRNLVQILLEDWDRVDIFCSNGELHLHGKQKGNIQLVPSKGRSMENPVTTGGKIQERIIHMARSVFAPELFFFRQFRYSVVVGVDPEGLIFARKLTRWAKRPLVYISFEIMFGDEVAGSLQDALKQKELVASRETSLVLVQDEERAEALKKENGFSPEQIILVPNAPAPETVPESNYLRERLDIPAEKRIVLYAGTLQAWSSRDLLEEMVSYWPENFALVLHNRFASDSLMKGYFDRLLESGKVFISPDPLPIEELTNLYASADFGLAPYKPTPEAWSSGKNIFHIGLSSGKVGYYAMCGLPVLASDLPVFKKEFAQYACGLVYSRISETGGLLSELDRDYDKFSRAALRFYNERLNPTEPLRRFRKRLLELA